MYAGKVGCRMAIIALLSTNLWAADIILNEYNAVSSGQFFNGGDAAADQDGGRSFDSYFGRVLGNGGDWFELVVIRDHLDLRGWHLDIFHSGTLAETLDLTNDAIWSDLRSGTIITVAEDVPSDISYNPAAGDWWINVQARDDADGAYITASSFPVNANDWQLTIRGVAGDIAFGPAGEGVSPADGVGSTNIFLLEAQPAGLITPDSRDYDDGVNFSTFGAPNQWGRQNLTSLRSVVPEPASISVLDPNGPEVYAAGSVVTVLWESQGTIDRALVEWSFDSGASWLEVFPPNVGNTGQYEWTVPPVDSEQCLIRVSSATLLAVYDTSDEPFTIFSVE